MPVACQSRGVTEPQRDGAERSEAEGVAQQNRTATFTPSGASRQLPRRGSFFVAPYKRKDLQVLP